MPLALIFAGSFGSIIGSFLNVVVYRVPAGRSIAYPPSACTSCGTRIRAIDNMPVVSWLLLRGRCRACGDRISARYPLIELLTGLFFALVVLQTVPMISAASSGALISGALGLLAFLYLAAISVVLALIDLDVHRLPDVIVLPALGIGAVLLGTASVLRGDSVALIGAGAGAAALFFFYLAIALVKPGGMGMGDVKLAAPLGVFLGWLGWPTLIVGTFAAFLLGGSVGAVLLLTKRATRTSRIPFGPFMLAGAWIAIFFGPLLWSGYLSIVGLS